MLNINKIRETEVICPECDGTGQSDERDNTLSVWTGVMRTCNLCDGYGNWIQFEVTCPECDEPSYRGTDQKEARRWVGVPCAPCQAERLEAVR